MADYDVVGRAYAERRRRPDPRIARVIRSALRDARSVLNVGAGSRPDITHPVLFFRQ